MTSEGPSRHHHRPITEPLEVEAEAFANPDVENPESAQISIGARLRQWRTLLSIAVPVLILGLAVYLNREQLKDVPGLLGRANPWLVVVAFAVYYVGFPLRGKRWAMLLHGAGYRVHSKDATEILFLSWLVNCIVPAKLGDVYRAYLLKMNSPVSATKTLGTVFIERILDLFAIAILGLAAGYWRFRTNMPSNVQLIFLFGVVFVILLAVAMIAMRGFGHRVIAALPLPNRVLDLYERFEEGVFISVGGRGLPILGGLTIMIWMSEAFRLWFVIQALNLGHTNLGISGVLFVALIGSLLTAVPLAPAGLGAVELGVGWVLTAVFGIAQAEATAIVVLDRAISVFSIVIIGAIAYVLSSKPRGQGIRVETVAPSGA